ncbi:MAG: alpha-glucosidase C-terminal domain-containing protein [Bacteroides sp.]|nr:alpha-glucosidase C-terminal domain-containing protein [Bacteroides sp.]
MKPMTIFKELILLLSFLFCLPACGNDSPGDEPGGGGDPGGNTEIKALSPHNRVIYEVNVRNYSAAGNFKGVEQDLPRLKELGVDILWLMPIHPIGEANRNGTLGSPYAVKDYKAVHPDFGTLDDLRALVAAAHEADMEIWLDWVANHTAWDHPWATEYPDYYAERDGQRPYSPENWLDVIQLDFSNEAMCREMIDAMKYWVQEADIDGFRCDAVTYVPLDFWRKARAEVNRLKDITWLAEGDDPAYMEVFDLDYAWEFCGRMYTFGQNGDVAALIQGCQDLYNNPHYAQKSRMVFLTNHDINAYEGSDNERYGQWLQPLTVLAFTIYDMPLIYNGQEIGMNQRMGLFDKDNVQWTPVNTTMNTLIRQMTRLKRTQPALEGGPNRGSLTRQQVGNDQVYAYTRKKGNNKVVIFLNFASQSTTFGLNGTTVAGKYTDFLTGEEKELTSSSSFTIPANGYAIFVR